MTLSVQGHNDSDSASTSSAESFLSRHSAPAILMTVTHQQHPHPKSSTKGANLLWPPNDKDLMAAVWTALQWTPRKRTKPIFDFALSTEAANRNFATLQKADFDLQMLLMSDGYYPLQPTGLGVPTCKITSPSAGRSPPLATSPKNPTPGCRNGAETNL